MKQMSFKSGVNVGMKFGVRKLESWGYQMVKKAFFVLTQYRRVTDRQTDRHVAVAITRASIALRG